MDYGDDGSICTHRLHARLHEPGRGDRRSTGCRSRGELPAWLTRRARARDARPARGGRAPRSAHWFDGVAMLNRFGFADGKVVLRQPLPREHRVPGREGGRVAPRRVRHRPVPLDLQARPADLLAGHHRQPEREPRPHRRALHRDDRDADAGGVRPETLDTIGHLEYADKLKAHVTTAHPHHDVERNELVNYTARFSRMSEYVLYGPPGGQLHAARDRAHAGEGAGVHARVRDERALPDPGRVPAAREPAEARLLRQAVHRELHLARGRAHALPRVRPRDRRAARHLRDGRRSSASTT